MASAPPETLWHRIRPYLKRPAVVCLTLGLEACFSSEDLPGADPGSLRVATFNLHHFGTLEDAFPDGRDAEATLLDVKAVQQSYAPDVWLFQEVYTSLQPNANPFPTDQVALLKQSLTGFDIAYHPENVNRGRFYKGNALAWNTERLSPVGSPLRMNFVQGGLVNDGKGAVGQVFRRLSDGRVLGVVGIHLDAGVFRANRERQLEEFFTRLEAEMRARTAGALREGETLPEAMEMPLILGGDFNSVYAYAEPTFDLLEAKGFVGRPERYLPTHELGFMLDHVFARHAALSQSAVVYRATHSDHYPVVRDLTLP